MRFPDGYLITLSARASTFGGIVTPICFAAVRRNSSFLISTQIFHEAYAPNTTFASLLYSFSDFVDFSTVKENSFASYALFDLDTFNLGDDHSIRTFRALYVSLIWQCHSDLPFSDAADEIDAAIIFLVRAHGGIL